MASFGAHFTVDQSQGKSKAEAIKQGKNYRITVLTERLIRLEYSLNGTFNDNITDLVKNRNFEVPTFKVEEDNKYLEIVTRYFYLQYAKDKPFKGPSFAPDSNLKVKLLNTDKVWYYDHPEARNFNGTAYSLDNYDGKNKKLFKGLYSTDGFVTLTEESPIIIDNTGMMFGQKTENIDIYLFMYKRDFGLCLKDYFTLTGYPLLIPRYALGIWWYRDRIYNFEDCKKLVKAFKNNEVPMNVLMLGEFWHNKNPQNINLKKSGYSFNNELFPDPGAFINYMHNNSVRVGLNIDPSEGINPDDECFPIFAQEYQKANNEPIPFNAFDKLFIAVYFENIINKLNAFDVDFYWLDYKDSINNLRALTSYHIRDYMKSENKRPMLIARNTNVAAHNNGVLYSGETITSWKTLKYLPFYNANASNIGISWWSHDIGGFKNGVEDEELYLRYNQLATFSPIYRLSAQRGIYYKREPWAWDFKTYNIVKDYARLRQRLIPYIYSMAYLYHINGFPLIQPLYYSYPDIYDEIEFRNEYLFGTEFLVCPITNPNDKVMGRNIKRLFLPKGIWYDFRSGKRFQQNKKYVTFYKDEDYPFFAKQGAIIPMANIEENTNLIDNPKVMDIHIFPGQSNSFNLYEDDGVSRLYEQGYYVLTKIEYNYMQNNYTVIIRPVEGKTNIIPALRDYNIYFRNTKVPEKLTVTVNNEVLGQDRVTFEEKANDFVVKVKDVDTTKQLTINCLGKDIEINSIKLVNEDINSIISDLKITTKLKEEIARIIFSDIPIKKKRIYIKKLKKNGLSPIFIKMFMKLFEYLEEI